MLQKADARDPQQVAVPFAGFVHALVAEGDVVEAGQAVATVEAMKMEAAVTAPTSGTVVRLAITGPQNAEGGDLLLVLEQLE
ncbi:MAG: biotin/lipoyl-containing protein [Aeromicrobium sp.]